MPWKKLSGPDEDKCSDCGEPIFWATTTTGSWIPLDPSLDPEGRVRFVRGRAEVLGRRDAAERAAAGEKLFRAHAASCLARRPRGGVGMPPEIRERIRRRRDPAERIRIEMAKRGSRRRQIGRPDG